MNIIRNSILNFRRLALLIFLLIALGCNAQEKSGPAHVTLVDVLDNPHDFAGQRVSLMGYLAEYANLELFLSKEHANARDSLSSIVVGDYDDRKIHGSNCLNQMVEITGDIVPGTAGNYIFVGVSKIVFVSTGETCWEQEVD